jgi:hypothetical protein
MRTAFVAVICSAVAGLWAPLALAQQNTARACQAEWQANKAIFQPKGITEQEYVDECRSFRTAAPSAANHTATRARPTAAPAQAPVSSPRTATPAPIGPANTAVVSACACSMALHPAGRSRRQWSAVGPDEFPTEAQEAPADHAFFETLGAVLRIPAILVAPIAIVSHDLRGPNAEAKPFEQAFGLNGSSGTGECNCASALAVADHSAKLPKARRARDR